MKKTLLTLSLLLILPSFASCPIEEGATVCSLPSYREQISPTYSPKTIVKEYSGGPETRLKEINRKEIMSTTREFAPIEADYNYNSGCQFGVCMHQGSMPLFKQSNK